MIDIGEFMSHSYLTRDEIGSNLSPDHISVFSAVTEGAYQSSTAFLHGLLPEKVFAKTVVRKSLANFCSDESDVESCHCHKTLMLEKNITESLNVERAVFDRYRLTLNGSFFQVLNDLCHKNSTGPEEPLTKYNSNLEEFVIASKNYISDFLQKAYVVSFATLYTYPFVRSLIERIKNSTADDKRIFVYMTDDLFWYAMVSLFDIQNIVAPASRMVFEIYEESNTGKHSIRALLDGNFLRLCPVTSHSNLCLLSDFDNTRQRTFEKMFLKNTYENICRG